MARYCFGIDVGGTTIKCGLFSAQGELVEKWEIPTRTEEDGNQILPDIAATIKGKMQEKSLLKGDVMGIGIGVPGPVNNQGEIPRAVNLNWGYKHISQEMEELTGLMSKAANDANVAALGEAWRGGAEGCTNVILVTLGTGVGGGIIVDGKVVAGAHGAGGEIGHANVNPHEKEPCNCGNYGCLEQVASATGIARLAKQRLGKSRQDSILRMVPNINAKTVFDAYKKKDQLAEEIVDEFAQYMGRALAIFASVVDPEVILLGGGVSKAGQVLVEVVRKYYEKYAFDSCKEAKICLATLGNDAGIYGAARLVTQ